MRNISKENIIKMMFGYCEDDNDPKHPINDEERKFYNGKGWDEEQLSDIVEVLNEFSDILDEIENGSRGSVTDGTLGSLITKLITNSNNLIEICNAIQDNVGEKNLFKDGTEEA